MSLKGSASSSASGATALGELMLFAGTVADYAAGAPAEDAERIASLACALATIEQFDDVHRAAMYFAARLRNLGAIANPAFGKGEPLAERARMMALRDIPAHGARLCERLQALPAFTADIVRWQAERYDGTGHPDQLRWTGIPRGAQLLHIATTFVSYSEPEEALLAISAEAGRAFSPEQTRSFIMWYHTYGGEIDPVSPPFESLQSITAVDSEIVTTVAKLCDDHNGTPNRSERIAQTAQRIARELGAGEDEARRARLAGYLFGIGELREPQREDERFDPLARLALDARAEHAVQASVLLQSCEALAELAPVVRARSEWFDGSGKPDGLRGKEIPPAAQALSLAIAYETLEEAHRSRSTQDRSLPISRLENSAGTQFDPAAVRALQSVLKAVQ